MIVLVLLCLVSTAMAQDDLAMDTALALVAYEKKETRFIAFFDSYISNCNPSTDADCPSRPSPLHNCFDGILTNLDDYLKILSVRDARQTKEQILDKQSNSKRSAIQESERCLQILRELVKRYEEMHTALRKLPPN